MPNGGESPPSKHHDERPALRIALWAGLPPLCVVIGAIGSAALGSVIGGTLGAAEGEGFIGFMYGLDIGPVLGLMVGILGAWRLDRAPRS